MRFNSPVFVGFALLFFLAWPVVRRQRRVGWATLTLASFVFYGWWDWRYLFLLIYTGLIDFSAGLAMERYPRRKKAFLVASLFGNVGSLAVFKYSGFLMSNVNVALHAFGASYQLPVMNLILPVGISFYTFESLSYTIDVYKGHFKPTKDILQFFGFLSMFPHLVAGPVIRPADLLPQLDKNDSPTEVQKWDGLKLIVMGYFKKMVIADNLAPIVNSAFGGNTLVHSGPYWWVVTTMFALQIYCDFSGYTDIARGLAKWMGYEFPLNFNHPYIADSIKDFWARWHISLSTWFRDYVYIPLGGSKKGAFASHKNMWITMLLSGLWHGAAWHFIIWAALHSFYLSIERITDWPRRVRSLPGGRFIGSVILLCMVWVSWVFFRAVTTAQAARIVSIMFSFHLADWAPVAQISSMAIFVMVVGIVMEAYHYFGLNTMRIGYSRLVQVGEPVMLSLMLACCVYLQGPGNAFIYFQF